MRLLITGMDVMSHYSTVIITLLCLIMMHISHYNTSMYCIDTPSIASYWYICTAMIHSCIVLGRSRGGESVLYWDIISIYYLRLFIIVFDKYIPAMLLYCLRLLTIDIYIYPCDAVVLLASINYWYIHTYIPAVVY